MADEIDTALADYEPTDSEDSVQDESVQMQNGDVDPGLARQNGTGAEGPIQGPNDAQLSDQELGGIANGQGAPAAVMSPAQLGNPNPMQAANSALSAGNDTALAQQDVTKAIGEKNAADADLLDAQAAQKAADEQEQKDLQASQNEALERTHAETERIQKQYDDFKFHDHWKEAAPANKALAILFSAIGGAANSRGLGPNEALKSMDDISEREYRKDVAELGKKENLIKWKREGEKDLASRYEKERAGLLVQQSSRLKMMGDLAQSQYLKTHPGATVDEAKQNVVVKGAYQKAAETYSAAVRDIYKIEAAKEAAKLKARKAGGGGNTHPEAAKELIAMREGGATDSEIAGVAADKFKIGPKDYRQNYLPLLKDVQARTGAENRESEKEDTRTVYVNGKPQGMLSSSRNVQKFADRTINYDDALKSLNEALSEAERTPTKRLTVGNPAYDRAVLAIATVTTANASDKTTEHEANTIKSFGLISPDAIRKTIEHVKDRKEAFMGQLQPLKTRAAEKESPTSQKVVTIKDKAGATHRVTMGSDGKYHSVE